MPAAVVEVKSAKMQTFLTTISELQSQNETFSFECKLPKHGVVRQAYEYE